MFTIWHYFRPWKLLLGIMCMLSCRPGIWFKASIDILRSYGHIFSDISFGHIFFAWIIMAIDSSDNDLIIFSHMPFFWWAHTTANLTLCPWREYASIHFSLWICHFRHAMPPPGNRTVYISSKTIFSFYSFICCGCLLQMFVGKPRVMDGNYPFSVTTYLG